MKCSIKAWVEKEFNAIHFGDKRLNYRFKSIMTQLTKQCGKTLASSFSYWKDIKASYRFFANAKVTNRKMLETHIEQTKDRIKECNRVLLLQDTTYLDYNNRDKTAGLDLTFRSKLSTESQGLMLHNTLAVSDNGIPLGLINQEFIDRKQFIAENRAEGRKARNWNKPIWEKESLRWINTIAKTAEMDFAETETIHVADRECDIYEFFREASDLDEKVLVRAARNRAINKVHRRGEPSCLLFDYLESKKAQGKITIKIQVNGKKKYRNATLSIVYKTITMPPPPNKTKSKDGTHLPMITLRAVMAIERQAPANCTPVHWVLLTNLEVDSLEAAIEKVKWYSYRWNVEVFHKVLKSGCGVEDAQLRHADRLKKYVTLKSIVAWRIFWLSRSYQHTQEDCCTTVLSKDEWKILYRKIKKTKKLPTSPPTVGEVFIWVAKLGGYIGRASDPPPGITSIGRGWQRLMDMMEDYYDICG